MSTLVGKIHYEASIDTSKFRSDASKLEGEAQRVGTSVTKSTSMMSQGFKNLGKVGIGFAVAGGIALAAVITKNVGGAMMRIDNIVNSKRTFANMGFDAKEAEKEVGLLEKGILGLPTGLGDAIKGMTQLSATYGSLSLGRKVFDSLNNGILGFGGSADQVNNAIMQLSQLPMDGPLDAQTWMSLRNSGLTPVLVAMSKDMGMGINEMKTAFGKGELTVEDFTNKLIELNEKGGGGLKSLKQIAQDSTNGIGSAIANMNNAIQRGIQKVVTAIGGGDLEAGQMKIASVISSIGRVISSGLTRAADALVSFINFLKENQWALEAFKGAVIGLSVAIAIGMVLALKPAILLLAKMALVAAPLVVAGAAIALVAMLIKNNWDKIAPVVNSVKQAFSLFWEAIKPIREFIVGQFKAAWNDLKASFEQVRTALAPFLPQLKVLGAIILALSLGPLVVVVVAITAAIAIIIAIVTAVARLIGWIAKLISWFVQLYTRIRSAMSSAASAVGGAISSMIGFFGRLISGVANAIGRVISYVAGLPGRIRGALGNLGGLLWDAGSQILQGLLNGLQSKFEEVKGFVSKIAGIIKDLKGPLPYDRKLLIPQGQAIMQGLNKGLIGGFAETQDIVSGMTTTLGNMSPAINSVNGSEAVGSNIENNIGTINIASDVDADRLLSRLTREDIAVSHGLTAGGVL